MVDEQGFFILVTSVNKVSRGIFEAVNTDTAILQAGCKKKS
jgi:hypothetical protein